MLKHNEISTPLLPADGTNPLDVLLIEGNKNLRIQLHRSFEKEGFKVTDVSNASELTDILHDTSNGFIAIAHELEGGKIDAIQILSEIRSHKNLPVITIADTNSPNDRLSYLEKGAVDYLLTPFEAREAAIRIRHVAQLYGLLAEQGFKKEIDKPFHLIFSNYLLDPIQKEVRTLSGKYLHLTETEYKLLEMFLKAPKRVLSRDEMMLKAFGREWTPLNRSIDTHVSQLRRKIETKDNNSPHLIKSVRGVGYEFTADVSCVGSSYLTNVSLSPMF